MTAPTNSIYFTPRLGLTVHGMDDELDAQRKNWDRLDQTMSGVLWVGDGTQPDDTQLFDGALVGERTSGKVWRAAKNSSGVFEKRWIKYPWVISAAQGVPLDFGANDMVDHEWGFNYVHAPWSVNASMSDLVNGRVKLPVKGLYTGAAVCRFGPNAPVDGARSIKIKYNDNLDTINTEVIKVPGNNANGFVIASTKFERIFEAGDTIVTSIWQTSSAGVIKVQNLMTVALVRAT